MWPFGAAWKLKSREAGNNGLSEQRVQPVLRRPIFMRLRLVLPLILMVVCLAGCMHRADLSKASAAPTLAGDAAHPGSASDWIETRLYFGLGPADQKESGVSESAWLRFLDKEVTPRFPDGLSVVDAYGQWQGKNETAPQRLRSKVLIIDHPRTAEDRAKIAAIRSAWKQRTGDRSVLEVDEPASVSF